MATTILRSAVLGLLLVLPIACADAVSPAGPTPRPPQIPPAPVQPADFPALLKPGRIFGSPTPLSFPLQPYTVGSRFVLYDDGTFALQYYAGSLEYRGEYAEHNHSITFEWEGWSTAGPWGAVGSLGDRTLTVRFNLVMQMSDFEDAIYTRQEIP